MGRTIQSAVVLVAKGLRIDHSCHAVWRLRFSACRNIHGEPTTALPADILAAICGEIAGEPTAAVFATPASLRSLPVPVAMRAGRPHNQQSQMVTTSTQYQYIQQKGSHTIVVDPSSQQNADHAAGTHLNGSDRTSRSNTKASGILSQCPDGHLHSWESLSNNRGRGSGHPQSQYASVQQKGPTVSLLAPALQQQWDHAANSHLGPIDIPPKSTKKVWWVCDQCPDGHMHRWEARVDHRSNGSACPQCCGRKVCKHNSLATKAPRVAAQWDYEANDTTPDNLVAQSQQDIGWLCDKCGHRWSAKPNQRVSKQESGCPECFQNHSHIKIRHLTFAECQDPQTKVVLAAWDHGRNAPQGNFPHNTRLRSNKQIFWLCNKCPAGQQHSWHATPSRRTGHNKSGCPFCAGKAACRCNSLQALFPAVAAEWDYANNKGQPSSYTARSNRLAWVVQLSAWQLAADHPITHTPGTGTQQE